MTINKLLVSPDKYSLKCPHPLDPIGICVHNCLPVETELLTRSGWITLEDITLEDEVATVDRDTLEIVFSQPSYKQPIYLSDTIIADGRGIETTEEHRMLVASQKGRIGIGRTEGLHKEMFMKDVSFSESNHYIPNAGFYRGAKGLPLSDEEIRLLVAIQADGSYIRSSYKGRYYDWNSVKIAIKKERKIERLYDILKNLDYRYKVTVNKDGYHCFVIYENIKQLCDEWLDNKVFNWSFLEMDEYQAELFIDELTYWDGTRVEHKNTLERRYSSSAQQNLDVVDAIASINGVGTIRNRTIITFRRGLYRVLGAQTKYSSGRKKVSCVTVDSGFILIRQNGVTTVVGNTANDAPAKNEIIYMTGNDLSVSFHIAVDDIGAWQGIPLERNAWHAGDGSNGVGNRKYIGIEICYSKSGGEKFNKAEDNAAKLIAQLLMERSWGIDRVKKHQDFSGKNCPQKTMELGWNRFLDKIKNNLKEAPVADNETIAKLKKDLAEEQQRVIDARRERDEEIAKNKELTTRLADTERICQNEANLNKTLRDGFFLDISPDKTRPIESYSEARIYIGYLEADNVNKADTQTLVSALFNKLFNRG